MTYHGHIENGTIILDQAPHYPNGTEVEVAVTVVGPAQPHVENKLNRLYERWHSFIGIAEGLPEDFAENHDYYAHGGTMR